MGDFAKQLLSISGQFVEHRHAAQIEFFKNLPQQVYVFLLSSIIRESNVSTRSESMNGPKTLLKENQWLFGRTRPELLKGKLMLFSHSLQPLTLILADVFWQNVHSDIFPSAMETSALCWTSGFRFDWTNVENLVSLVLKRRFNDVNPNKQTANKIGCSCELWVKRDVNTVRKTLKYPEESKTASSVISSEIRKLRRWR